MSFLLFQGANEVIADYGYDYLSVILIVSFGWSVPDDI